MNLRHGQRTGQTGNRGGRLIRAGSVFSLRLLKTVIVLQIAAVSARAAEQWVDTRQTGPFICQATFSLKEYEPLLAQLQELQPELIRTLGIAPAAEPMYIYLFSDKSAHRRYLEAHYPEVPYRPALFVKEGGLAGVYAYRHKELDVDLRHECTHALLHANLPMVPLWLDEGLAKYFEVPAEQRAFEHPNFFWLRWEMRLGLICTVNELEERHELAEMGATEYRYSWAWVHFMLHGPEGAHATLVNYLADIHRGAIAGKLSDRLAQSVPNPTGQMIQHFKHWHP